jgi:hypothetical protein
MLVLIDRSTLNRTERLGDDRVDSAGLDPRAFFEPTTEGIYRDQDSAAGSDVGQGREKRAECPFGEP